MTYSISKAHADGRHASTHPDDRTFWIAVGCTDCQALEAQAAESRLTEDQKYDAMCAEKMSQARDADDFEAFKYWDHERTNFALKLPLGWI